MKLVGDSTAQSVLQNAVMLYANAEGQFYLSASTAAENLNKSERTAQRAIKALEKCGVIVLVGNSRGGLSKHGGGYANTYQIVFDHDDVCPDGYAAFIKKCKPAILAAQRRRSNG